MKSNTRKQRDPGRAEIVEHQPDAKTRDVKYVIVGATLDGTKGEVVAKIGVTGKLFVITTYRA